MILSVCVDEVMSEWPVQWYGKSRRAGTEGPSNLRMLKALWNLVRPHLETDQEQQQHFRALWLIGFELSRDYILDEILPSLPNEQRLRRMIEDCGPLLFGYYTDQEEECFAECCETFERVLRQGGLWDNMATQPRPC